ncbi:hypothetical protein N7478_002641 [Penicillium angulare]|uniref:uncharacterized protein n=1 Tax=Penicillium angulare TaxID=116970 RepID=UPI0025412379|nr:uncharacterized protein N7478_002641 [Penicillium angulare]KAJ5286955.1 hypothetical protein N7478_002641 [Penicillium angulare]
MSSNQWSVNTKICLPRPYLTAFHLVPLNDALNRDQVFQLSKEESFAGDGPLPGELHNEDITFTKPTASVANGQSVAAIPSQQSSRRLPISVCAWNIAGTITTSHIWLIIYTILIAEPELEVFGLELKGPDSDAIAEELCFSMVAIKSSKESVTVCRNAFWQGCASPLGSSPIWTPFARKVVPHSHYVTTSTPTIRRTHPLRPPNSSPGSTVYSRYIPSLNKLFSLVTVDYKEPTHVEFFHQSKMPAATSHSEPYGDSLEESFEYLRRRSDDPHTIGLLGQFDETLFGYFEVFWVKEDPLGVAVDAGDFDRGLSGSVGYSAFKSRRWLQACWSSLLHYIFLDEHRTDSIITEAELGREMLGDASLELLEDGIVDLPHQRAILTKNTREAFFSLCPFDGIFIYDTLQIPSRL